MRLSELEFRSLTPNQIAALSKRHDEAIKKADYRAGIIAATIANVHRGKRKREYKPEDFMPKYSRNKIKRTPEQLLEQARLINLALGGKNG